VCQNNIFYGRPDGDALNPLSILCIRKCLGMGVSHTIEGRAFLQFINFPHPKSPWKHSLSIN